MDEQLNIIKSNPDPAARQAATQEVNRIFGEKVYNWWLSWTLWAIISQPYVNGVQRHDSPTANRASASPSPVSTRPTRSGATKARASSTHEPSPERRRAGRSIELLSASCDEVENGFT